MIAVGVVSAGAVEPAKTVVDVKKGDEVSYILNLGEVAKPVIGCDFLVYFDSDVLEVASVADFTGSTDEGDWEAMINPALDGEVRGNWSILKGVDFKDARDMLTVNFKAKADGSSHLSYFIRYLYDDTIFDSTDKPQIKDYVFTCNVKVNGEAVLDKAQPELNVEESQNTGIFVNSLSGDSKDADPEVPGAVAKPEALNGGSNNNGGNNNVTPTNNGSGSNDSGNNNAGSNQNEAKADGGNDVAANPASTMGTDAAGAYITATDAQGNVTATSDTAPAPAKSGGSSAVIWIVLIILVVAGGGAAFYFTKFKKNNNNENSADNTTSGNDSQK